VVVRGDGGRNQGYFDNQLSEVISYRILDGIMLPYEKPPI